MVVETLLIVSVASLNLTVVPGCSWANELVMDMVFLAKLVKRMNLVSLFGMCKFAAVIRLYSFGSIAKEGNCSYYKVNSGMATILFVGIYKTLP